MMRGLDGITGSTSAPPSSGRCPGQADLSAFSRGALPLASLKSIAEHVSVCVPCDSKVSTLVSDLAQRATVTEVEGSDGESPAAVVDSGDGMIDRVRIDPSRHRGRDQNIEAPTAPLRLGQYRLVRQLGRGGMGVVYQAVHERLRRDVAIKFVPVATANDLLDVERLRREMAAVGTMRHPNVVYATDAGEAEGIHYLVMEYVDGVDLSKLVHRLGPLPVAEACEIIRQAAQGLAHVHSQKLVHRDLKPSNLMLASDGTVKILDLGLARAELNSLADESTSEMSRDGYLLGTMDYLSPEQARHPREVDIRSDIYSLGCTFYKLLTGQPPFGSDKQSSVAAKILAHERTPPPPLAEFRGDVPDGVEVVLGRMLAKEPRERFQTPAELQCALVPLAAGAELRMLAARTLKRSAAADQPRVEAHPGAAPTRSQRHSTTAVSPRSRARLATAGACLVGLLAIMLWGWYSGWFRSEVAPPRKFKPAELAAANSMRYPGELPIAVHRIDRPQPGELKLESNQLQLVNLGRLRQGARKFTVCIDQSQRRWIGEVGIFLGYRVQDGVFDLNYQLDGRYAVFQLLHLATDGVITDGRTGEQTLSPFLQISRQRVFIHPDYDPSSPKQLVLGGLSETAKVPRPAPGEKLRLEIYFHGDSMTKLVANGMELSNLTTPDFDGRFTPVDYQGPFGFFNYGQIGGAIFSDFDLADLEQE